ncbi:MAG: hypothetical protein CVV47_06265 [Spirochaetae bacterium HGW-Spirochaetae-3]|jgi:two-component system response regulator YesN|nr:MAG: hypothetical protein CVV47_06265 [Spirochaetae bacterium HGW-Spirochaetae-3]
MIARIFLADDERPVLEGVAAAIRKRLPDVAICGTASTGREAVDGAIRERPDVILMDVRMPGMSGLDALRELRASAPETVPILLTAYERFDVAKEAFGLGVYDYLVKPVDQDLLVEAIRGAADAAAARKAEAIRAMDAIEALDARRPLLEEGLVFAALAGDCDGSRIRDYASALSFAHWDGGFAAFRRRVVAPGANPRADEDGLRSVLSYRADCAVGVPFHGVVPVFFPGADARAIAEAAQAALLEDGLKGMSAGVGPKASMERLGDSWKAALAALGEAGPGGVAIAGGPGGAERPLEPLPAIAAALSAASIGDPAAAAAAWASLPDDRILQAAVAGAVAWSLRGDAEAVVEAAAAVSSGAVPRAAFNSGKPGPGYGTAGRAIEAMRVVKERYAEPLSLEEVADRVGLSAAHLSRVLSSETGKSFMEHLSEIRIAKAKAELASGRLSVKEVGAAVGYSDPNYFSRAFKRETGMTPSEYARAADREDT